MLRAVKVEVIVPTPVCQRWLELSTESQRIQNFLWSAWIAYHTYAGTAKQIAVDIQSFNDWKTEETSKRKAKPKWKSSPFPNTDWCHSHKKNARRKNAIDIMFRSGKSKRLSMDDVQIKFKATKCKAADEQHLHVVSKGVIKAKLKIKEANVSSGSITMSKSDLLECLKKQAVNKSVCKEFEKLYATNKHLTYSVHSANTQWLSIAGEKIPFATQAEMNSGKVEFNSNGKQSLITLKQRDTRQGEASPPDLKNDLYHLVRNNFPRLMSRTVSLIISKWSSTLETRKATSGNLPGWAAILLCNESIPMFLHKLPIMWDKHNAPKNQPITLSDDGRFYLKLKLESNDEGTIEDRVRILLNKDKMRKTEKSAHNVVQKIVDGEYSLKGSTIHFSRTHKKWFASFVYELPEQSVSLDVNQVMYLRPGRSHPWAAKFGDEWPKARYGTNCQIPFSRQQIEIERNSRRESYRWASSSQKGRGRKRAESCYVKLSDRWKNKTKQYNHEVSRRVINECVERGFGKIVFYQPVGTKTVGQTYLANEGRAQGSKLTWNWFQIANMLQEKASEYGIEVEVRRWGTEVKDEKEQAYQARRKAFEAKGLKSLSNGKPETKIKSTNGKPKAKKRKTATDPKKLKTRFQKRQERARKRREQEAK